MIRHPLPSATRGVIQGLDVLIAALVVVAVVQAPSGVGWPVLLVAGAFGALYVWGRLVVRVHERSVDTPRGRWWPDVAWIAALLVAWAALLWLSPAALWLAFPLMLLQMHALGPHRGVVAVVLTAVLAVADGLLVQADVGEPWTGFVLGPVLGAAVAVGVVSGIEAFVRESQTRQRTVDELTQVRQHLAQAERERAVTDERARLARDIHDTLAQSLSAIELLLRAADDAVGTDDDKARTLIEQARAAARDSLAEARRVVEDLTPGDLERTTLVAALRRVAERAATTDDDTDDDTDAGRRRPLAVSVRTSGTPRPLPVPLETALLRIAQSALANVTEHAGAAHARMTVTYDDDTVTLDVVDDGTGFDAARLGDDRARGRGFGIPAIRSRVHELGGTLALETSPGSGTAVAVTLPTRGPEDAP
ncbi:signal transduction histidine kinase [Isoptericola sp. CG 20/1183]|uniref:Oxygen sensor histidine kinase NreB n=1 Tax=Isoptericola halotolerans TaxID=300560 RepID=A0ABX5EJX3_9MICO|nr:MULTISPECIES: sensor histidine kinase [Isoptericola]PRZ02481.1 signal transduction histidine kinase [Isoptericola sp. CG 20/1183]PRZ09945.1 signal transduction histidine kinase [Isoptericola halotolerans]